MKLLTWQRELLSEKDIDIFEVIAIRRSGKEVASLAWITDDADISIFISHNASLIRRDLKDKVKEYDLKVKEFHVIANLDQLKNLNTHQKRKIRIVVDEYFYQPDITLDALDKVIGHENYKVLFIGTRTCKEDKFRFPISKQYVVDLIKVFSDRLISSDQLTDIINSLDNEQFEINFGAPFETN